MSSSHPSDDQLLRVARGERSPELDEARSHAAGSCDRCRTRLEELARVTEVFAEPPLAEVPEHLSAWAREWISEQAAARPVRSGPPHRRRRVAEMLEEIRAVLVFDTASGVALQGIRGDAATLPRQMLFESPAGDLHLQVTPQAGGRCQLHGRFLSAASAPEVSTGKAVVERAGRSTSRRISATGEFCFEGIAVEGVRLHIEWGGRRVSAGALDVGGDG